MNRKHCSTIDGETAPDANEEYLLYQTLLGAWPLEGLHEGNRAEFIQRIQDYMVKALHEAKANSSWLEPNAAWDEAVRGFVAAILASGGRNRFPQSIGLLADRIAQFGAVNSLTQTVLKLTCPGVPDFYQGNELWDFSLVDPDNRRPVDFDLRQQRLADLENIAPRELLEHWQDGRIKLYAIHRLLTLRRELPALFASGSYTGISALGVYADKVIAFERRDENETVIVIVPRHAVALGFPPLGAVWEDTCLEIPDAIAASRDIFTGREFAGPHLALSETLSDLPFAVLRPQH